MIDAGLVHKRIKAIIDYYGYSFFISKTICDLGAMFGDVGGAFSRLGATLTAVDIRDSHLSTISKKYPHINCVKANLENEWPFKNNKFDIIFSIDLLCHLKNWEEHIKTICQYADHIVIESEVIDSSDPTAVLTLSESNKIPEFSFSGNGSIPSAKNIENILIKCGMNFRRYDNTKLNSEPYSYSWVDRNSGIRRNPYQRRFWFVSRNKNFKPIPEYINEKEIESLINKNIKEENNKNIIVSTNKKVEQEIKPKETINLTPIKNNITYNSLGREPKIAVAISGHLRTFDRSFPTFIRNIMWNFKNYDTFIHTWDTIGAPGSKGGADSIAANISTNSKLQQINSIINPKCIEIENQSKYFSFLQKMDSQANLNAQDKAGLWGGSLVQYAYMLLGMTKVRDMISSYEAANGFKYDMIIRLRSDLFFTNKIEIKNFLNQGIYVPNIGQYYNGGMNDQVAIGDNGSMKVYFSLFDNILEYINKRSVFLLRPEIFLKHHLIKNNISINEVQIPYYIARLDYTATHLVSVAQTR